LLSYSKFENDNKGEKKLLQNDLLSRIVIEQSRARIDALRAAAEDLRHTPEEASSMRALAALFEAERDLVNSFRESKSAPN